VEEEHRRILRAALLADGGEKRKSFWQVLGEMPDAHRKALKAANWRGCQPPSP